MTHTDPDRFFGFEDPGSQEWWYFDAISDDGRDALVLIWFAALPFDPAYGVATLRYLRDPRRRPAPRPLDHCAINLNWYHDGRLVAYALNGFRSEHFVYRADPFAVEVAGNRIDRRDGPTYDLHVETPAVDTRSRIRADLTFHPATGCAPVERNLGTAQQPHHWILAAADGRLEGEIVVDGRRPRSLRFLGRGYHDHNAGREDFSIALERWSWGRVHHGERTEIYYHSIPRSGHGEPQRLWITCQEGEPVQIRQEAVFREEGRGGNVYGVRHGVRLAVEGRETTEGLADHRSACVDDGPFYRRWVSDFHISRSNGPGSMHSGISELLVPKNLHSPLFNWMIPYRLKRPQT